MRRRWGRLPGGMGIAIMGGTALLGAVITIAERRDPGALLGVFLVLGTLLSGLAVRPRSAYLLIPAPILWWAVTATLAGAINDRATDTSKIGLLLHGGTWIASGFVAMCIATIVAVTITGIRIFLDFRSRSRGSWGARPASRGGQVRPLDQQQRPVPQTRPNGPNGPTGPRGTIGTTGPRRPQRGTGPYAPSPGALGPGAGAPGTGAPGPGGPGTGAPGTGTGTSGTGSSGAGGHGPGGPGQGAPGPGPGPRGTGPYPGAGQYPPPRGERYNFSSGA